MMNKKIKKRITITVIILLVATFLLYLPMICSFHQVAVATTDDMVPNMIPRNNGACALTYKGEIYKSVITYDDTVFLPPKGMIGKKLGVVIFKSDRYNPVDYFTGPLEFLANHGEIYQSKTHKDEIVLEFNAVMEMSYVVYRKV